jgi:hypothetical protein
LCSHIYVYKVTYSTLSHWKGCKSIKFTYYAVQCLNLADFPAIKWAQAEQYWSTDNWDTTLNKSVARLAVHPVCGRLPPAMTQHGFMPEWKYDCFAGPHICFIRPLIFFFSLTATVLWQFNDLNLPWNVQNIANQDEVKRDDLTSFLAFSETVTFPEFCSNIPDLKIGILFCLFSSDGEFKCLLDAATCGS